MALVATWKKRHAFGRENAEQIQEWLKRAASFSQLSHPSLITLNNDGAIAKLVQIVQS